MSHASFVCEDEGESGRLGDPGGDGSVVVPWQLVTVTMEKETVQSGITCVWKWKKNGKMKKKKVGVCGGGGGLVHGMLVW